MGAGSEEGELMTYCATKPLNVIGSGPTYIIRPKLPDWCYMPGGKSFLKARCFVRVISIKVYIPPYGEGKFEPA